MTVAELITELQRFPPHHTVIVVHEDDEPCETNIFGSEAEASIIELKGGDGGYVLIDCVPDRC
jgi:hypothetical protein